jgi:hypothetical protein
MSSKGASSKGSKRKQDEVEEVEKPKQPRETEIETRSSKKLKEKKEKKASKKKEAEGEITAEELKEGEEETPSKGDTLGKSTGIKFGEGETITDKVKQLSEEMKKKFREQLESGEGEFQLDFGTGEVIGEEEEESKGDDQEGDDDDEEVVLTEEDMKKAAERAKLLEDRRKEIEKRTEALKKEKERKKKQEQLLLTEGEAKEGEEDDDDDDDDDEEAKTITSKDVADYLKGKGFLSEEEASELQGMFEGIQYDGLNLPKIRAKFIASIKDVKSERKKAIDLIKILQAYIVCGNNSEKLLSKIVDKSQGRELRDTLKSLEIKRSATSSDDMTAPRMALAFIPVLIIIRRYYSGLNKIPVKAGEVEVWKQDLAFLGIEYFSSDALYINFHKTFSKTLKDASDKANKVKKDESEDFEVYWQRWKIIAENGKKNDSIFNELIKFAIEMPPEELSLDKAAKMFVVCNRLIMKTSEYKSLSS